jgi:hypothetical protein
LDQSASVKMPAAERPCLGSPPDLVKPTPWIAEPPTWRATSSPLRLPSGHSVPWGPCKVWPGLCRQQPSSDTHHACLSLQYWITPLSGSGNRTLYSDAGSAKEKAPPSIGAAGPLARAPTWGSVRGTVPAGSLLPEFQRSREVDIGAVHRIQNRPVQLSNPATSRGNRPAPGYPKLREHLGAVVTMMQLSSNWHDFMARLDRLRPRLDVKSLRKGQQLSFDYDSGQDNGIGL